MSVLDQHLHVLRVPFTRTRRTLKATLAITLTTRLNPDNTVNMGVVVRCARLNAEASGGDVAPLAPFLAGAELSNTALVDDEVRRKPDLLEVRGEGVGVVGLVPGVGPLGEVFALRGDEGVVVGDVGDEAADLGFGVGLASELDNGRELSGACNGQYIFCLRGEIGSLTYLEAGCRPSRASHRERHRCTG